MNIIEPVIQAARADVDMFFISIELYFSIITSREGWGLIKV